MSSRPAISIVVAAVNTAETLAPWLEAVRPQLAHHDVEVLIAAAADDRDAGADAPDLHARIVRGEASALVPALWGVALLEAQGDIVAITITACLPAGDWLDAIAAAYREAPADGIGGVIDYAPGASLTDRALHLVRYTPYLPPLAAGPVTEIAGDNGTYSRAALAPWRERIARDGFWESEFNRHVRARGGVLRVDPRIRVTHTRSYSPVSFAQQRFQHGRIFGRSRRRTMSAPARLARVLFSSAVPPAMLARALRTVAARGRLDARTVMASPLAAWFFWHWAIGEATGLLFG